MMNRYGRAAVMTVGLSSALLLGACDVTNPGPVPDESVSLPASQQGLVTGAVRRMSELMGYGTYSMALLSREIFPGGQIGAFGHSVIEQGGHLIPANDLGYWNDAQQARYIAETAILRFNAEGSTDNLLYQAHLWAGFAYRVMGEWWCDAVIGPEDPTDPTPGTYEAGTAGYFNRAVDNFTDALGYAATDEERFAAYAGRAQAYAGLGQWASAAADAAAVTDNDFVFFVPYDGLEQAIYNTLYWANRSTPYRSYSMHFTWAKELWESEGDPRVRVVENPALPLAVGSLSGYGPVPWSNQTKYPDVGTDQRLVSGWEMRLIEAEAILQQNQAFAGAMTLINEVRTRTIETGTPPLAAATAGNADEAWTALKHERAVELFLEGRRLYDERRWMTDGSGGTIDVSSTDWDSLTSLFTANPRSYCLDIPNSERNTNPNVPPVGG